MPGTRLPKTPGPAGVAVGEVGSQCPPEPVAVSPRGVVASSLIAMDVGFCRPMLGVRMSLFTDSEFTALGATRHEQHAIITAVGSNAYTFTHMLPVVVRPVGSVNVPVFVRLIVASARSRLAT